jgi:hypothetical protein
MSIEDRKIPPRPGSEANYARAYRLPGGAAMTTTETPAAQLRAAVKLMRFNAVHVPPPPWFATVRAVHDYQGEPIIANCGTSVRAIYVAAAGPGFLLAAADWLEATATDADGYVKQDTPDCGHEDDTLGCHCDRSPEWGCDRCGEYLAPGACTCWEKPLAVARAYLDGAR